MLTLINTNRMSPPIGPLGLEYLAGATSRAGIETQLLDLCFEDNPITALDNYLRKNDPGLIGLTFRNVDDCFWPSAKTFVPDLKAYIQKIRQSSEAPVVIGGVGFSIFPEQIVRYTGADFGIHGDGEQALILLYKALQNAKQFESIEGLIWREAGEIRRNNPSWPAELDLVTNRDVIDNRRYFKKGGQAGIETKRGCNRKCIFCADRLAKGCSIRTRTPASVAEEVEALLALGVDVLHLCDSEFNIPRDHAYEVCMEFINKGLGDKIRWYVYLATTPFDADLALAMKKAGCVGINFTGDSASSKMLKTYRHPHTREDLAQAVKLCRQNNIAIMFDLMIGGPGETERTARETIEFIKETGPDCAGAALGIRIYPGTEMADITVAEGPLETNPNIRRKYDGPIEFFKPTFYISHKLGSNPAGLIKDLIDGDNRFFEPTEEVQDSQLNNQISTDHNYNDNTDLVEAIKSGQRGAYWDILRKLKL